MEPSKVFKKNSNLKRLKKTQAHQICHKIEDLDENIRRLQRGVDYVKYYNKELKKILKNENNKLKTIQE